MSYLESWLSYFIKHPITPTRTPRSKATYTYTTQETLGSYRHTTRKSQVTYTHTIQITLKGVHVRYVKGLQVTYVLCKSGIGNPSGFDGYTAIAFLQIHASKVSHIIIFIFYKWKFSKKQLGVKNFFFQKIALKKAHPLQRIGEPRS